MNVKIKEIMTKISGVMAKKVTIIAIGGIVTVTAATVVGLNVMNKSKTATNKPNASISNQQKQVTENKHTAKTSSEKNIDKKSETTKKEDNKEQTTPTKDNKEQATSTNADNKSTVNSSASSNTTQKNNSSSSNGSQDTKTSQSNSNNSKPNNSSKPSSNSSNNNATSTVKPNTSNSNVSNNKPSTPSVPVVTSVPFGGGDLPVASDLNMTQYNSCTVSGSCVSLFDQTLDYLRSNNLNSRVPGVLDFWNGKNVECSDGIYKVTCKIAATVADTHSEPTEVKSTLSYESSSRSKHYVGYAVGSQGPVVRYVSKLVIDLSKIS
ncbi:MAG: hypothetical protein SPJ62_03520 [Inconstantimicrobium porci]|uniref:hypothetical protein n=1 Tax=Inconstantimicrobium porci TaxID=2652291 RepID=UPI002A912A5F|nr:hypothetical protein [Inconstantimicrobium porci]MDY5911079.1 hypothetical protein [Inconstantimicrobium porci]